MSKSDQQWRIERHEIVTSTMDLARAELAQHDRRVPFVIVARQQTGGRGRQGRSWSSPLGGLYLTVVYPWDGEVNALSGLSLVVGLALRDALGPAKALLQLKWPNDVITTQGRKLAGILIEVCTTARGASVLIGIGVNLSQISDSNEVLGGRISDTSEYSVPIGLSELISQSIDYEIVLSEVLENLSAVLEHFKRSGFEPFRELWLNASAFKDCLIRVDSGNKIIQGSYAGVASSGALLLETPDGVCEIASGHILSFTRGG